MHDKAFNIAKNPKYDGYQRGLASMVYNFFDKITSGGAIKNDIMQNKESAEKSFGGRVKVELDLSNYATKAELKNATGADTSKFAKMADLANLKPEVDKLDIDFEN